MYRIAKEGLQALSDQARLSDDPKDDEAWNSYACVIRSCLKRVAAEPPKTKDDILVKALLLALTIQEEGKDDQRYKLARTLIGDINQLSTSKPTPRKSNPAR